MEKEELDNYSWQTAKSDITKLGIIKNYNKDTSPITLYLDLERANRRAKARGLVLVEDKKNKSETRLNTNEIIKTVKNAPINFEDTTVIEKHILKILTDFQDHTAQTIIDDLTNDFPKNDILGTIEDMRDKGWIKC